MSASKKHAVFRFFGSLNDFLSPDERPSGVPHPEVDLIVVNGNPVDFEARLTADDRVSVYPWIRRLDLDFTLRPPLPRPLQFVCDVHLGRLARHLRMVGLDTRYDQHRSDAALARLSDHEERVLLTRDVGLLKRSRVQLGAFVRAEEPFRQFAEVARRFDLGDAAIDPFSRCLDCNTLLEPATPSTVASEVPPHARKVKDAFWRCPSCDTVYWEGSHVERMRQRIRQVLAETSD